MGGGWEIIADINLHKSGDEKIINLEAKRGRYFRLEIFLKLWFSKQFF